MIKTPTLLAAALGMAASASLAASQTDVISVALNTWHKADDPAINPNYDDVLLVIGSCNATNLPKTIEGWVRKAANATPVMAASLSGGTGRQSITFVVPPEWEFGVVVNKQGGTGIPPGGSCNATVWWSD